jgi:hypothetical protein
VLEELVKTTVPGLNEQVNPDGDADAETLTVPTNPLTAAALIVEDAVAPAMTETARGLAASVKSWIVYVTTTLWDREPLVPETVTR